MNPRVCDWCTDQAGKTKHAEIRRLRNKEKGPGQLTAAIILGRGTLSLINDSPVGQELRNKQSKLFLHSCPQVTDNIHVGQSQTKTTGQ